MWKIHLYASFSMMPYVSLTVANLIRGLVGLLPVPMQQPTTWLLYSLSPVSPSQRPDLRGLGIILFLILFLRFCKNIFAQIVNKKSGFSLEVSSTWAGFMRDKNSNLRIIISKPGRSKISLSL
jgi:hypothetical protein